MAVTRVETSTGVRWRLRFYQGSDPGTGKRTYITETFDRKKDADARETQLRLQRNQGVLTSPARDPLGVYLRRWLEQVKRGQLRERTWSDYSGVLRRYIEEPPPGIPDLGKVRVDRLTPEAVQALYHALQEDGGLSPRTIRSIHAVVRQGLAYAVKMGAAPRNVAALAELPRMDRREVKAMSQAQAARFLEAARGDRYWPLWAVLISGGLRPGEALALRWPDLDLEAGKIHVQRTLVRRGVKGWKLVEPKTSRGRRVVVLPGFAVQALRELRTAQRKEQLLLGAEYERHGFVFANEWGRPLELSNLHARNFRRIMAAAELGEWEGEGKRRKFVAAFRLYDLRHTAATLLLRAGVNPKVTSERLGHASVSFTMDVYAASLPDLQEEAAAEMERLLGEG